MLEIRNYLFRAVSDRIVTWLHAAQPPDGWVKKNSQFD